MNDLKVSVVVPVYNREYIIKPVIESLIAQDYPNLEIVMVDDGSKDKTAEIIKAYPQVRLIEQQNQGAAGARNTGIFNATGDIVHFIDSDVIVPPDVISEHVKHHIGHPRRIVQGQIVRITDLEDIRKLNYNIWYYSRSFFDTANVSVRREHLLKVEGFDQKTFKKGWEDLDLGLRLRKECRLSVKRLGNRGWVWHHEGGLTPDHIESFYDDRHLEGETAVDFYRKHPTYGVKLMTMIGPLFFWLDKVLFNEEKLKSQEYFDEIKAMWAAGKQEKAMAKLRVNAYHFYINGIKDRIREDGYILKK